MGRGEQPRAHTRCAQHRVDHRRHRALAVGPGDVDRAKVILRVAQQIEQRTDVLQTQLDPEMLQTVEPLDGFVHPSYDNAVMHGFSCPPRRDDG